MNTPQVRAYIGISHRGTLIGVHPKYPMIRGFLHFTPIFGWEIPPSQPSQPKFRDHRSDSPRPVHSSHDTRPNTCAEARQSRWFKPNRGGHGGVIYHPWEMVYLPSWWFQPL